MKTEQKNRTMKKLNIPKLKIQVKRTPGDIIQLENPRKTIDVLKTIFDADQINWIESAIIICLNRNLEIIGCNKFASGGTASVIMDKKVIFQICLNSAAHYFILSHNHPSGNLTPSQADLNLTKDIAKGAKLLDLELIDHVIITDSGSKSLAESNPEIFK